MASAKIDIPCMESYKLKFSFIVEEKFMQKRKTGTCSLCGRATSKKKKAICLTCSYKNIELKYNFTNGK